MNTDCTQITSEQIDKPSEKILLAKLLQKLDSGGHKVLIFSQMVCVLDFLKYLLRVKHSKYKRLDGLSSASHHSGAVNGFFTFLIKGLSWF